MKNIKAFTSLSKVWRSGVLAVHQFVADEDVAAIGK